jgi:hypothetical protein
MSGQTIEKTVGSCDVLIAVIGKGWLTSCDQEGQRRLDNPEDFVRIEIATAIKRDILGIPLSGGGRLDASVCPSIHRFHGMTQQKIIGPCGRSRCCLVVS